MAKETKPKKLNKKSLEYVRPDTGRFELNTFPGVEFRFRKISIDDEAWAVETFGKSPWEIITGKSAQAADLCRLYFHFLTDDGKQRFIPVRKKEMDYETGEEKDVVISGPRLFMQSIDGGSLTEMVLISRAFVQTVVASRPISELPDDVKKSVLKWMNEAPPPKSEATTSAEPSPRTA
jgi:hypothetical protein